MYSWCLSAVNCMHWPFVAPHVFCHRIVHMLHRPTARHTAIHKNANACGRVCTCISIPLVHGISKRKTPWTIWPSREREAKHRTMYTDEISFIVVMRIQKKTDDVPCGRHRHRQTHIEFIIAFVYIQEILLLLDIICYGCYNKTFVWKCWTVLRASSLNFFRFSLIHSVASACLFVCAICTIVILYYYMHAYMVRYSS